MFDITPNLLMAIDEMYSDTRAKVVTVDGETEEFVIRAGVLQRDTLAPFLFVIVLDYVLRQAISGKEEELGCTVTPRRSRRIPGKVITDLDFADDIALLSNDLELAQRLLSNVEEECKRVGLHRNASKTKVLFCNTLSQNPLITSNGNILEQVHDFKYLGSWVSSTKHDIKVRKALAWKALNTMCKVWKSGISKGPKCRLFVATVESVLLYSCQTWSLTSTIERSVDGTYTRCSVQPWMSIGRAIHLTRFSMAPYHESPTRLH